jgi:hypothetical protein
MRSATPSSLDVENGDEHRKAVDQLGPAELVGEASRHLLGRKGFRLENRDAGDLLVTVTFETRTNNAITLVRQHDAGVEEHPGRRVGLHKAKVIREEKRDELFKLLDRGVLTAGCGYFRCWGAER